MVTTRRTYESPVNFLILRSFEADLMIDGRAKGTIRIYVSAVRQCIAFQESRGLAAEPANYSTEHLREWFLHLIDTGRSEKTRSLYWAALRKFYAWLVEQGEVRESPMARFKRPAVHDKERAIYTPDEIAKLTESLEPKKWTRATARERFLAARDAAIVWTFYAEGFRRAELLTMRLTSDTLDDPRAHITRKGGRDQEMRLAPRTMRELLRYLRLREQQRIGDEEPALWVHWNGKPLTASALYNAIKRRVTAVGLVWNKRALHSFRHASAVAHVENGMPSNELREQFGWTSDVMVRHYTRHNAQQRAGDAHRKYSPGNDHPR
jgi:integrase/recombinase XerC/integrase/recombinase XerD